MAKECKNCTWIRGCKGNIVCGEYTEDYKDYFVVTEKIKGKDRPRFYKNRVYTTSQTKNYEKLISQMCAISTVKKNSVKPIKAKIYCNFQIPKSFTKKKKGQAQKGVLFPTKKPDCDNIVKVVLDSLNGIAYEDDKQVIDVRCIKQYNKEQGEEIVIYLEEV